MKMEDLDGWVQRGVIAPPVASKVGTVLCLHSTELEVMTPCGWLPIPLAVLANILRLRGWTVVPPQPETEA